MRPDQIAQLGDLQEQLADVFINEATPGNWSGTGKLPVHMDQQERGDAYWCRKNAIATGGVLRLVMDLKARLENPEGKDKTPEGDDDLDDIVRDAKRKAEKALQRVMGKTTAAHGKR
jgi:hypothetical protein